MSKDFTGGEGSDKPLDRSKGQFEASEAAKNLVDVVSGLKKGDNGTFRDYKNDVIPGNGISVRTAYQLDKPWQTSNVERFQTQENAQTVNH